MFPPALPDLCGQLEMSGLCSSLPHFWSISGGKGFRPEPKEGAGTTATGAPDRLALDLGSGGAAGRRTQPIRRL